MRDAQSGCFSTSRLPSRLWKEFNVTKEAFIYDALRTPRGKGKSSGALYEIHPIDLVTTLLKELQKRHQLDSGQVDDVILGCVAPVRDQGGDIARFGALYAGWDVNVPGVQINRFCASGLDAVNTAAIKVRAGWEELIVAGGVESMSRVPMGSDGGPGRTNPRVSLAIGYVPQGIGADLLATIEGFNREDVDRFAVRSQRLAAEAREKGYFKSLVPVKDQNGIVVLEQDE
jgi:acetyl-CoA C-acetyltransferase